MACEGYTYAHHLSGAWRATTSPNRATCAWQSVHLKNDQSNQRESTIQRQAKDIVRKADRSLFGQMLIIAQSRQLHMKDLLSHPLGPLLWALANGDGSLWKTNNAVPRELEKLASPAENISEQLLME